MSTETTQEPGLLEIKTAEMEALVGPIKDASLHPDIGHCSCQCACSCVCMCGDYRPKEGLKLWESQGDVPEETKYH